MLEKLLEAEEKTAEPQLLALYYTGETIGNLLRALTKADYPYLAGMITKTDGKQLSKLDADAARENAAQMLARFTSKGGANLGNNIV